MSNMENLDRQLVETTRQAEVNAKARESIAAQVRKSEAQGYGTMAAVMGYGEASLGTGAFGKISHAAQLFCIGFAFLAPCLLVWHVLL